MVRENLTELGNWKLKVWSQLAQTAYAWPARVGLAVIASVSLTGSNPDTVTGRVQVRPPSCERLATIAEGGFTRSPRRFSSMPRKYAVPSGPTDIHGSLAESAVPPVQTVRPGIWLRRHVLPPSLRPSDEIAARGEAEILLPGPDEVPPVRRVDRDRRLDLIPRNMRVVKRGSRTAARKRAGARHHPQMPSRARPRARHRR